MSHTGVLSVGSPLAALTSRSRSRGSWQCPCSFVCPRIAVLVVSTGSSLAVVAVVAALAKRVDGGRRCFVSQGGANA